MKKSDLCDPYVQMGLNGYECATTDVQKGLRYCLRLSFTLYCHGLPVPKEKKTLKQYKSVKLKLYGCSFDFCWVWNNLDALY